MAITEPGDEVIIPCPTYTSYREVLHLAGCKPVYETLPGWTEIIGGVTSVNALPKNVLNYIQRIAELVPHRELPRHGPAIRFHHVAAGGQHAGPARDGPR